MKFGVLYFATDEGLDVRVLGQVVEGLGLESVFLSDHTHIPVQGDSDHPLGGEAPREYSRMLDPLLGLTAVATATSRLLLGMAVCLVVERDPIILAKQVATLDHLSGGRVVFGVGAGWNRAEMANHGTDGASRFEVLRERVLAMKAIWTEEEAAFEGRYVRFGRLWSWPKPKQKPHPPILVGGAGKGALRRVVELGDGWIPAYWTVRGDLEQRIANLRQMAADAGREMPSVTVLGATGKELAGDVDPDVATLKHYEAAGVSRWIFRVPSSPPEAVLARLSVVSEAVGRFGGP